MSSSNGHGRHQRDVSHERAFTIAAAAAIDRSPLPIMTLADARAPMEPLRDFTFRDFHLDALEELADCRNYIVWAALRLDLGRHGPAGAPGRAALQRALAHTIEAFAEIGLARSLMSPLEIADADA